MHTFEYVQCKKAYVQAMKKYMDLEDTTDTGIALAHLNQLHAAWHATWS